jgi:hypothetical protein
MKVQAIYLQRLVGALLFALAAAGLPAFGQEPARLNISGLEKLAGKAAQVVDVNLDGSMLRLASKFMDQDDPDSAQAREVLEKLKGIYVKSFEFEKEGAYSEADVEAIRSQLHAPAWTQVVSVRSRKDGDNADVYLMGSESNVQGLAIIAAEPKELTVVNIVGPIDINKLSEIGGHLGVPNIHLERHGGAHPETKPSEKKP